MNLTEYFCLYFYSFPLLIIFSHFIGFFSFLLNKYPASALLFPENFLICNKKQPMEEPFLFSHWLFGRFKIYSPRNVSFHFCFFNLPPHKIHTGYSLLARVRQCCRTVITERVFTLQALLYQLRGIKHRPDLTAGLRMN